MTPDSILKDDINRANKAKQEKNKSGNQIVAKEFEQQMKPNNKPSTVASEIKLKSACLLADEDMTTLDTTKNIAYMHICQVISSANYSIIYLCYPEQKYFTYFCVLSNCRCMGHLYNPHMKIREKEKFRCCSKSPLTSLLDQEKIESKSLTFWIQIRTAQTYLTRNGNNFFIRTS